MKKASLFLSICAGMVLFATVAFAHFGMLIPSDSMVMPEDERDVQLQLSLFTSPKR